MNNDHCMHVAYYYWELGWRAYRFIGTDRYCDGLRGIALAYYKRAGAGGGA